MLGFIVGECYPNLIMPRLLQIALHGHPCLRERAANVATVTESLIQELIDDMIDTMIDAEGVGLAAPQVYRNLRLFVMRCRKSATNPDAPDIPPFAVINPAIIHESEEQERGWESCLSFPGYGAMVSRPKSVKATWIDRDAVTVERELVGRPARVFLHELDHLNGVMFFDRLESLKDLVANKEKHRVK